MGLAPAPDSRQGWISQRLSDAQASMETMCGLQRPGPSPAAHLSAKAPSCLHTSPPVPSPEASLVSPGCCLSVRSCAFSASLRHFFSGCPPELSIRSMSAPPDPSPACLLPVSPGSPGNRYLLSALPHQSASGRERRHLTFSQAVQKPTLLTFPTLVLAAPVDKSLPFSGPPLPSR